ncbi:MAG TPA: phosphoenolpyruvate--protein phosphotransferase [bacterium]|nr:phosphoenolpyruvate--protein phosphotransferase [bacterium]
MAEKILQGVAASGGIAIAPLYLYHRSGFSVPRRSLKPEETEAEVQRYLNAIAKTRIQIGEVADRARHKLGEEHAAIFKAHQIVLDDPVFQQDIPEAVRHRRMNAEALIHEELEKFKALIAGIDDPYFRERGNDIQDVGRRMLKNLTGGGEKDQLKKIDHEVVLIAEDLSPSDTVNLPTDIIKGFATEIGGRTSHVAIVARSLSLPAIVGMPGITAEAQDGDTVILDGNKGLLILNPTPETLKQYQRLQESYRAFQKSLEELRNLPASTPDGRQITLAANIEIPQELNEIFLHGAEGVGLFRTEFLFLNRESIPTEEEQYLAYRELAEKIGVHPAIVRTLDLGGDKFLSHLNTLHESNPFLGLRAIRLCLKRPEIFMPQLRAMLRAAAHGPIKIMFPMISSLDEVRQAKAMVREAAEQLRQEGRVFRSEIEIGAMIEIPSAAVMADLLIEEVDFLSIGTNDLIQYTLAVDRVNESVAYLYEPGHPAILRLIQMTVDAAHRAGKWVGMCGEMAGDPQFVPLLLGMGLDEFSVSVSVIPEVKKVIRMMPYAQAAGIAQAALKLKTSDEVLELIKNSVSPDLKAILF